MGYRRGTVHFVTIVIFTALGIALIRLHLTDLRCCAISHTKTVELEGDGIDFGLNFGQLGFDSRRGVIELSGP
ncbi:hypothetical protein FQZ97_854230 [compost metagenome]